jgi:RNA polymerase sigma factor (sigma-70 family)
MMIGCLDPQGNIAMNPSESAQRISRIDTLWSVVGRAHGDGAELAAAQRQLLERYGGAARRYLLAATRSADAADEIFQDFALRFLRGALRGASPERGRFRDYLKAVLRNMVADFHNKARRHGVPLTPDLPEPAVTSSLSEDDEAFLTSWRDELLARSWAALQNEEEATGEPHYTVLRFRADNPNAASPEMAAQLSEKLGKPYTGAAVRQALHRARERFGGVLLDEVAQAVADPTADSLADELVELGLLDRCRAALARRYKKG